MKKRGFTLAEMVLALGIILLILAAVYSLWNHVHVSYDKQSKRLDEINTARNTIQALIEKMKIYDGTHVDSAANKLVSNISVNDGGSNILAIFNDNGSEKVTRVFRQIGDNLIEERYKDYAIPASKTLLSSDTLLEDVETFKVEAVNSTRQFRITIKLKGYDMKVEGEYTPRSSEDY